MDCFISNPLVEVVVVVVYKVKTINTYGVDAY